MADSAMPRRRAAICTAARVLASPPSAAASATAARPSGGAAVAACQASREGGTATPSVLSTFVKYSRSAASWAAPCALRPGSEASCCWYSEAASRATCKKK